MILLDKTYEQIMNETLADLEGMGIRDKSAGSVARLLLNAINKRLHTYYGALKVNHAQAFVSKAKGDYLDMIGQLLDCHRQPDEAADDEAFRYRITKQIQIVASANKMAVRLAALSVDGVQDVMMKRFTHGTGSYSVYVISEMAITPQSLLDSVQEKIEDVEGFGIRGEVFRPIVLSVEMKVRLIFNKTVPDLDRRLATAQAQDALQNYTNSRNVGQTLSTNDIKKLLQEIHPGIEESILFNYKIDNRPVLAVDQVPAWNERYIESDKPNAIQIM